MALEQRQSIMEQIEAERGGRSLVCFFNFDRQSTPTLPGLSTQFHSDAKEALFRVLKETSPDGSQIDLCLYTRGGDTNSVWPIASLLREWDRDFHVEVPFRCHSGGTMLALASKKILMGPLSELGPIDPSTGNQFNPKDDSDPRKILTISVEDVQAYRHFVLDQFNFDVDSIDDQAKKAFQPFLQSLSDRVHPLALGNVHRAHLQTKQLAKNLLNLHNVQGRDVDDVVDALTSRFYSHLHVINRYEANDILGSQVEFSSDTVTRLMDELLRAYEDDFALRRPFFISSLMGDEQRKEVRFIGGVVESKAWSYQFETKGVVDQFTPPPPNVQVQLPPGQVMPLIPGLSREYNMSLLSQGWTHNIAPQGVTL
jgi:hypothetical protein